MENNEVGELIEDVIPTKYRHWIILLYEDTSSYDFKEVLRIIKSQRKWAYIKHIPENDEKKEHFHVILSFDNATKQDTLAKKLGVPINFIRPIKSFRTICRYLIHKDDEDKFQYSLEQVKLSKLFEKHFLKQFDDIENEEEILSNIYSFISNLNNLSYIEALKSLIYYVNIHCYDRIYKRYRYEFLDCLKMSCN